MKVLSLFDGMACGALALRAAGIEIDRYVAYEIDKYAIKTSSHMTKGRPAWSPLSVVSQMLILITVPSRLTAKTDALWMEGVLFGLNAAVLS